MMKTLRSVLVGAALIAAASGAALAQRPAPPAPSPFGPQPVAFAWWKNDAFKKELGMTAEQGARIDKIWETTRPELRQEWDELSRLEDKFSRLLQLDSEEAVLSRQIDRVETARANTNKTRSLMLVQMLKVLTPDQRSRFNALYGRWQQDLLKQPPPMPPANQQPRDQNKRPED
jgi:Spy/CpxP family protein refolding chaperone